LPFSSTSALNGVASLGAAASFSTKKLPVALVVSSIFWPSAPVMRTFAPATPRQFVSSCSAAMTVPPISSSGAPPFA
jgi:hypothetical protein